MRKSIKQQINTLLSGKNPANIMEIWIVNPTTGEETLYGRYPNEKSLKVIANSPETAQTLEKLREGV